MIHLQAAENYPANHPLSIQKRVRDILATDPYFTEHHVRILMQDEGEMATMIEQKTLVLTGPVLVIAISSIEPNPPSVIFGIELIVTEQVTLNRNQASFDTALGIAWRAASKLSGDDFLFDGIHHFINGDGLFQAVAALRY